MDEKEMRRIARLLLQVLQETYDWCGYDAPNWRKIEYILRRAKDVGLSNDT